MKRFFLIIAFISLAQILAASLTPKLISLQLDLLIYEPFNGSIIGSLISSIILMSGALLATSFLLFIVKVKRFRFLKVFLALILSFTAMLLTTISLLAIFAEELQEPIVDMIAVSIGGMMAIIAAYSSMNRRMNSTLVMLSMIISAEVGAFFAITFSPITVLLILIAFALYDVYTVFKGPLKKLIEGAGEEYIAQLSMIIGDVQVGMGDLIFYCMLPSVGFVLEGLKGALITILATDIGIFITFTILLKKKIFPGLPLPVSLGSIALLFLLI
ncbi:MAG: hypothetical protein ACUVTD_03650 [Nitrososphaerales archaeon]